MTNTNGSVNKTQGSINNYLTNLTKAKEKAISGSRGITPGEGQLNIVDVAIPNFAVSDKEVLRIDIRNPYTLGLISYVGELEEGQKVATGNSQLGKKEFAVKPCGFAMTTEGETVLLTEGAGLTKAKAGNRAIYFKSNAWLPAFVSKDADNLDIAINQENTVRFEVAEEASEVTIMTRQTVSEGKAYKKLMPEVVSGYVLTFKEVIGEVTEEVEVEEVDEDVDAVEETVDVVETIEEETPSSPEEGNLFD